MLVECGQIISVINGGRVKFKLLLLALGVMMKRASRNKPEFKKTLEGKDMTFEISSEEGVCRSYTVKDERVTSSAGKVVETPEFAIRFDNSALGWSALTHPKGQAIFMKGIQDKTIRVEGNPMQVMWFQKAVKKSLPDMLKGNKKKKAAA